MIRFLLVMFFLLPLGMPAVACTGDDHYPVVTRNGESIFDEIEAENVYAKFPLVMMPINAKKAGKKGILVQDLFRADVREGRVTFVSCGGKARTFLLSDLRRNGQGAGAAYVALTKKGTLKLITAISPDEKGQVLLKRITRIEIESTSVIAPGS